MEYFKSFRIATAEVIIALFSSSSLSRFKKPFFGYNLQISSYGLDKKKSCVEFVTIAANSLQSTEYKIKPIKLKELDECEQKNKWEQNK